MRLSLLIPELIWSEPGDSEAQRPAERAPLAKILASRRFAHTANPGWEVSLLQLAGFDPRSSLAALRMIGDGLPPADDEAAHWLCADPVHLRFHQERLILADARELALSADECAALAGRLNAALAGQAEIRFAGSERAYLRLEHPATPTTAPGAPLSQRVGRAVRPGDFGADAQQRALANEIQMLLHDDPVNRARAAAGAPAVNALWLWGRGQAPRTTTANADRPDAFYGDHPLLAGIARRLGAATATNAGRARHAVRLDTRLTAPTQYQDSEAFAAAWAALDQETLRPALADLRAGRLGRLDLVAPVVYGQLHWSLGRLDAWLGPIARGRWPALVDRLAQSAPPPAP